MFLDPVESFLTMNQAARALDDRLHTLLEEARARNDTADADYYTDRIQYAATLAANADPDDIFEQDAFRRLFTAELTELPTPHASSARDSAQ